MKKQYLQEIVEKFGHLTSRVSEDFDWEMFVGSMLSPLDWVDECDDVGDLQESIDDFVEWGFHDCHGVTPPENLADDMLGLIAQHAQDELDKL